MEIRGEYRTSDARHGGCRLGGLGPALLPEHIQAAGLPLERCVFQAPIGIGVDFSRLLKQRAEERLSAETSGARAHILVAHGTIRNSASKRTVEAHAEWLRRHGPIANVRVALIDEEPRLRSVLRRCAAPGIVDGVFAAKGRHATVDVMDALASNDWPPGRYLGPAGSDPRVLNLFAKRFSRLGVRSPSY